MHRFHGRVIREVIFLVQTQNLEGGAGRHTDITQHNQSLQIDVLRRVEETRIRQTYTDILSLSTIDGVTL